MNSARAPALPETAILLRPAEGPAWVQGRGYVESYSIGDRWAGIRAGDLRIHLVCQDFPAEPRVGDVVIAHDMVHTVVAVWRPCGDAGLWAVQARP